MAARGGKASGIYRRASARTAWRGVALCVGCVADKHSIEHSALEHSPASLKTRWQAGCAS